MLSEAQRKQRGVSLEQSGFFIFHRVITLSMACHILVQRRDTSLEPLYLLFRSSCGGVWWNQGARCIRTIQPVRP